MDAVIPHDLESLLIVLEFLRGEVLGNQIEIVFRSLDFDPFFLGSNFEQIALSLADSTDLR